MNLVDYLIIKSCGDKMTKKKFGFMLKRFNSNDIDESEWNEFYRKVELLGGYDALEDE